MYSQNYDADYYSQDEFEKAYEFIKSGLVAGIIPDAEKCTIILGGQPGAGKSTTHHLIPPGSEVGACKSPVD